jgi:hypothetical protein
MNQALQDVIEHRRTTNVSSQCGQLADYSALEGRLAPSADVGFMSPELVAGWVGAAKGLYEDKPQMQRDEAIRSATFGAGSLLYAAEVHGFGSCPMIGFDAVAVTSEFTNGAMSGDKTLLQGFSTKFGNLMSKDAETK